MRLRFFATSAALLCSVAATAAEPVLGTDNVQAIKGAQRVAIDEFGIEFVTGLRANGGGGGSTASVHADLQGVSDTEMQALTDRMYKETVEALTAAGFEVVDQATLLARPDVQALADQLGKPSPIAVDDGNISRIFAPTGMKAFFQMGTPRGAFGDRTTALNSKNAEKSGDVAKAMGVHFVRFHYLASFGTANASHGFLANFTGKARASVEIAPTLVAQDTQAQIVSHEGPRIFTSSSRIGVNGAVYLDKPLAGSPEGFALQDTTTQESKNSDAAANALSIGLSLLTGTRSASQTSNSTSVLALTDAQFDAAYAPLIASARDAFIAKLKASR